MRSLVEKLKCELNAFLEQSQDLILLASCGDNDIALILKIIRDTEQSNASDIFLLHSDAFFTSDSFVTTAVNKLAEDHRRTNTALENLKRKSLPPFPDDLLNIGKPASARLKEAFHFSRCLLPNSEGHRFAWAMFPAEIDSLAAYLQLIQDCSAREGIKPWMHGVRLIFRVPLDLVLETSPLAKTPRLRWRRFDFSPPVLRASMEGEAEDMKLPEAERMNATLALATLDYAHGRVPEAVRRYQAVFEFARKTDNPTMQALALNGLGDIPHRQGNFEVAQHWYECAIKPALAAQQPVVLANLVQNLAAIAYQKSQFADAAQYYDSLCSLKTWLMDPVGRLQALEGRGLSQVELGQNESALASFEQAALLGVGFELPALAKQNFEHMRKICLKCDLPKKLAEVDAVLRGSEA